MNVKKTKEFVNITVPILWVVFIVYVHWGTNCPGIIPNVLVRTRLTLFKIFWTYSLWKLLTCDLLHVALNNEFAA